MIGSIRSELRKAFTTRLWWGLTLLMMVIAGLIAAGFASSIGKKGGLDPSKAGSWAALYTAALDGHVGTFTIIFPLVMGIILTTTEIRHKTLPVTYWATPTRWEVLVGKSVSALVVGLVLGLAHVAASIIGAVPIVTFSKQLPVHLGDTLVLQSMALSVLAIAVTTLLGLGFGTVVRHQVAAVSVAVAVVFIGELLLQMAFTSLRWDTAELYLPGLLIQAMLSPLAPTPPNFTWSAAALIMTGYAAVLAAVGYLLYARRDVT